MPKGKRMGASADTIESQTMKGPANYPGEAVHGHYGTMDSGGQTAGGGTNNLSPPRGSDMGNPMAGVGLPPANGINMGMVPPPTGEGTLPPSVPANPGLPLKCELPPGPDPDPGQPVPCALPPGPEDFEQGNPESGITPPGPPL